MRSSLLLALIAALGQKVKLLPVLVIRDDKENVGPRLSTPREADEAKQDKSYQRPPFATDSFWTRTGLMDLDKVFHCHGTVVS